MPGEQERKYVDSIKKKLSDVSFPTTKDQLLQKKGNERLEVGAGKTVTMREALQPVSTDRFSNANELINNINEAHHLGWPRV